MCEISSGSDRNQDVPLEEHDRIASCTREVISFYADTFVPELSTVNWHVGILTRVATTMGQLTIVGDRFSVFTVRNDVIDGAVI